MTRRRATDVEAVARAWCAAQNLAARGLVHEDWVLSVADLLRAERRAVVRLVKRERDHWTQAARSNANDLRAVEHAESVRAAMRDLLAALAARDGRTGGK